MKLTYHCNLVGNKEKLKFLELQYHYAQVISRYYLMWIRKHKEFRKNEIHKATYRKIRDKYPFLYAKLVQHVRDKVLGSVKAKKLYKTKKITTPLIFDYQNFNVEFVEGYYNAWVRICKRNYPLEGLRTIEKIKGVPIKEIQIKKISRGWKAYFICEVGCKDEVKDKKLGIDINLKNITLSDNKRYSLKRFVHQKVEYRKKKQKEKIINYTKNEIHTLTSQLVKYLIETGGSRIVLEDLTNIRKSSSRKEGTSKGRNLNYLLNNVFPFRMFQNFLDYKCRLNSIDVLYVDPKNTSKTCSLCGLLNTERPRQSLLVCKDCGRKQNADLNGAKNILLFSEHNGLLSHSNLLSSVNKETSLSALAIGR